jgi:hypothetical protein
MSSSQRTLLLIFGIGCLLIISILLISVWSYRELIAFLVIGLAVLAVLMTLTIWVIRAVTDLAVKVNEANLRRKRLHPDERLVEGDKELIFLPSNPQSWEGQKPYSQGYDPKDSSNKGWD